MTLAALSIKYLCRYVNFSRQAGLKTMGKVATSWYFLVSLTWKKATLPMVLLYRRRQ